MSEQKNERWVYVGNLSPDTTHSQIIERFRRCGEMSRVKYPSYKPDSNSRSVCLLYDTKEEMNKALRLTLEERTLGGRILTVKKGKKVENVKNRPYSSTSHNSEQGVDLNKGHVEETESPECEPETPFSEDFEKDIKFVKEDYASRLKAANDAFDAELKRFKCLQFKSPYDPRPLGTPPPTSTAITDKFLNTMGSENLSKEFFKKLKLGRN